MARGRSTVAVGFTYFAAVMMMLTGGFEILQGLSAIIKKHFYVVGSDYVYKINVTTWGWDPSDPRGDRAAGRYRPAEGRTVGSDCWHHGRSPDRTCEFPVAALLPRVGHRHYRGERPRRVGSCCSRPRHCHLTRRRITVDAWAIDTPGAPRACANRNCRSVPVRGMTYQERRARRIGAS